MTTTKNEVFLAYNIKMVIQWRGEGLTFGGSNKNLVEGCTGGEMIRFLKRIGRKPTQVNIPNLLNS